MNIFTNSDDKGLKLFMTSLHTNVWTIYLYIICCIFCGTAPSMEGKHAQQYTSTSGWSWRHGTNSEGYSGGLREFHSVYCCCSSIQWCGRQPQVRYDNCQDRRRRYVLHTVCYDLTQFTSAKQTFYISVENMWNNSYLNCGCRWKWKMIIAVNFPI